MRLERAEWKAENGILMLEEPDWRAERADLGPGEGLRRLIRGLRKLIKGMRGSI